MTGDEHYAIINANAEFIVRACNSHDALVGALKGMLEIKHRISGCKDPECLVCKDNNEKINSAISALRLAGGVS